MISQALACPSCGCALEGDASAMAAWEACPGCGLGLRVVLFPAFGRPAAAGPLGELVTVDGESACFFHPSRRAAIACDRCGRLVCALCELEVGELRVCPECLPALDQASEMEVLERHRVRHDSIVWALLVVGVLFFFLVAPVCGLAGLVWAIRHWRSPSSRVVRTRWRLALAVPVALVEVVLGIRIWVLMFGDLLA